MYKMTADCRESIYYIAGPEFGSEKGSIMIVKKALYGLKSSGAAFRAHLAETLHQINYCGVCANQSGSGRMDQTRHQAARI
jgi:hypothetical protein